MPVIDLNAARVWVAFDEVQGGHWAAGGRLYRLNDGLRFVTGDPTRPDHE